MDFIQPTLQILQGGSALLIIVFVLLHSPKGDGLGAMGGAAQMFSSQKGAEAALNRTTAWIAGIFYVTSFILGHYFPIK